MEKQSQKTISWTASDLPPAPRSRDWFWTVGTVSIMVAVAALLVHNWLFSILSILAGITILLGAVKKPRPIHCSISPRGVVVNRQLFTYNNLTSFWIEEEHGPYMLTIGVSGSLIPRLWVPLGNDVEPHTVRAALAKHLPEERYEMSAAEIIGDRLGIQ